MIERVVMPDDDTTTETSTATRRHLLGLLTAATGLAALNGTGAATGSNDASDQTVTTTATTGDDASATADDGSDQNVTIFFGLVRSEDMSQEEFEEYYFENHVPTAKQALAELEVLPLTYEAVIPDAPAESPFSAVAWLTFASQEVVEEVTATEQWERAAGDLGNFTRSDQNVIITGAHHDNFATDP